MPFGLGRDTPSRRKLMRLSSLLAFVVFISACGDPNAPSGAAPRITELPRPLSAGEQAVIGASNAFGFALLVDAKLRFFDFAAEKREDGAQQNDYQDEAALLQAQPWSARTVVGGAGHCDGTDSNQ